MAQLTNIRTVSVPSIGKLPLADKPGTFTPSGTKREHKAGRLPEDGGHTESGQPAKLELNLNLTPGVDITAINAIVDEDVTVRLSDGKVHMLSMAFVSDPVPVGDDGGSKITIMANTSEPI
ncbi:phage tail tube protein [Herbaspirillum chlorophenolicum]|uniref:phage tail tube protein n=1 Tax=Herbaspirillum chlorophenolicum TaxID=211589 RepID=UPI00067BE789|nr:phage tail tube protein [Herbaspirillum chlorophenolicum]